MTNQVKQFFIGDEVQFLGDNYKVVELLDSGESVHIKKTSPPGNSMVVPRGKLASDVSEGNIFHTGGTFIGESETDEYGLAAVGIKQKFTEPNALTKRALEESSEIIENKAARYSSAEELFEALAEPSQEEADKEIEEVLKTLEAPDLLYRPDDRITLSVEISPEVQAVLDEIKKEE